MGTQRKCDKCPNLYGSDEAPGILCPICQVGADSFERAALAIVVGLFVIGGAVATLVAVWGIGATLARWAGFAMLAQAGLVAVAVIVALFVSYVIGETVLTHRDREQFKLRQQMGLPPTID